MAKQRNSLGICVLTLPDKEITWEEYKDKYGVDLSEIVIADSEMVKTTKLIAIEQHIDTTLPIVSFAMRFSHQNSDNQPVVCFGVPYASTADYANISGAECIIIDSYKKTVSQLEL